MTTKQELRLKRFQTKGFEDARSISIYCTEGSLWVTAGNSLGDRVVYAGKEIHLIASGKVVVEALADSVSFVTVMADMPQPHAKTADNN